MTQAQSLTAKQQLLPRADITNVTGAIWVTCGKGMVNRFHWQLLMKLRVKRMWWRGVLMDCWDESLEEMSYVAPEVNKNGLIFADIMSGSDNQKERVGKHASPIRNEEQERTLGSLPLWILRAPTGLHLWFIFIWEMSFGQSTREKCAVLTSCANAAKHKVLLISSSLDKEAKILCFVSITIIALWTDSLLGVAFSQELWFSSFCVCISHITVWKQPTEMTNLQW